MLHEYDFLFFLFLLKWEENSRARQKQPQITKLYCSAALLVETFLLFSTIQYKKTPNIVTDLEEIETQIQKRFSKVCTENLNIAANIKICCLFVTRLVEGD